jgi:hypothetical protein
VGRSLFERGYVHATAGNISVRLADGYLITPTDACLGTLQPERLARLDAQGHAPLCRQPVRCSTTSCLLDRFEAAARDGFEAVEYLFPYAAARASRWSTSGPRLQANGLQQVLFNAPPGGNWDAGERGTACLPGREAEFRAGIAKALRLRRRPWIARAST